MSWKIRAFLSVLPALLLSLLAFSQNLVPNPSFENNTQLSKYTPTISDNFKNVNDWDLLGWQSFYCHCKTHDPLNWHFSACRKHLYKPRSGCAMIKMVYEEASRTDNNDLNAEIEYKGATSYLECKLTEPLKLGSVYEISFWVYFPEDQNVETSILTHIGFLPTLRRIGMRQQSMLTMNRFFADSIPFDQWFEIKKYIRALCPLEFLVIGAFRNNSFPLIQRFADMGDQFYFIDDVSVKMVNADSLSAEIIPTPFCAFVEEEEKFLEVPTEQSLTVYFETGSSELSALQQIRLDSFIEVTEKKWKPVYSIIGHTDNTGNENQQLSYQRAASIRELIKLRQSIPHFRTTCFSASSDKPASTNETKEGRSQNRRVEIQVTSLDRQSGLYRYCLELCDRKEFQLGKEMLLKWIATADEYKIIYLLFDHRFDSLLHGRIGNKISSAIQSRYKTIYKSPHTFYLDSLRCEDQRYRTLELSVLNLSGYFKEYDKFPFEKYAEDWPTIDSLDRQNINALLLYLKENPFPVISEVGRRNARGAAYMLIHSGDTSLLEKYVQVVYANCMQGEAEWDTYAMIYDRNLMLKGKLQEYGTQYVYADKEKSRMVLAPVDNLALVNERRILIGLPVLFAELESD